MNDSASFEVLTRQIVAHHWMMAINPLGMWVVGPVDTDGLMNILGMGRDLQEAFEMAKRSAPNG